MHLRQSILNRNFNKDGFFAMGDLRVLAAMSFVGLDPEIPNAQHYLDVEALKTKLQNTSIGLGDAPDIQWNPGQMLQVLESKIMEPIQVAKKIFSKLSSSNPVFTWGSGDDLYGLAEVLACDFLLFHKSNLTVQHIKSGVRSPVCTILLYYHDMIHFQGAGIVEWVYNSLDYKLFSVFDRFELSDRLYDLVMTQSH